MIKTLLIGHLGKEAIVKVVNSKTVINFSVAHSEKYKNHEGVTVEKTLWVECAYWTDRTAIAQYLKKGTQVFVEGIPSVDTYTNAQGVTNAVQRLRVGNITLLGSKQEGSGDTENKGNNNYSKQEDTQTEPFDDLPF